MVVDSSHAASREWLAWLLPPLFIALITALAGWLHRPPVLFPELGALATVVLLQPDAPWSRRPIHLLLLPFLTACTAELCLHLVPFWPLSVLLSVGFSIALLRGLRSPLAPALACGLSPWTFQLQSWSFPLALLVGTGLLALISLLRLRLLADGGAWGPPGRDAVPVGRWLPAYGVFLGLALVLIAMTGQRLILFPPLLVIAYELMVHPQHCPWHGRMKATVFGCTLAAASGTVLASWLGVTPLATALTMVVVELLQRWLGLRMLPAFGAALIPFLLPEGAALYPACVAAGTSLLAVVVRLMLA